ncbi:hypothetical protein GCM10007383_21770 [Arenibacter certesii]|uniref:Uncharacterized protein n=1 Tax=Arenibacter certesii TaxID=228955 RepID=A0A918IY70_9FLAO|nr:hypothetical protein GCM10007383_21770 [Arenibacter certesii]
MPDYNYFIKREYARNFRFVKVEKLRIIISLLLFVNTREDKNDSPTIKYEGGTFKIDLGDFRTYE